MTVIVILLLNGSFMTASNNLLYCDYHSSCVCPNSTLVFVCSASDGAATVWTGSIFNCPSSGNEILLRHSRFDDGVSGTCNDGAAVAYSTEITDNTHISQLNYDSQSRTEQWDC